MNNNLNFALYNSFLAIRISPWQGKCKYKGCGSHLGPYSSRKNPLTLLFGSWLIWLTNRSHPGQCYTGSSPVSIYPSATADELNLECLLRYVPSLYYALPSAAGFYKLMFYLCFIRQRCYLCRCYGGLCSAFLSVPRKVLLQACVLLYSVCFFVLCLTTPGLCSAFPSPPVKFVTRFCCVLVSNFILRVLPPKHWVCAVLFPWLL